MKITNAVKKLERAGFEVTEDEGRFRATKGRHVVVFYRNGTSENATAFGTTTTDAGADSTPLYGWPSLTAIIRSTDEIVAREAARA